MMPPNSHDFQKELDNIFMLAQSSGDRYVDVISGEVHRRIGGYPGRNHRMPLCCEVMKRNMKTGDQILEKPPKEKGASLIIRYRLPR
jgi:5-methylcytosine-specific restriction protein A